MEKQCGAADGLDKRLTCSYHLGRSWLKKRVDDLVVGEPVAGIAVVVAQIGDHEFDAHASADMRAAKGVVDCSLNALEKKMEDSEWSDPKKGCRWRRGEAHVSCCQEWKDSQYQLRYCCC